MPSETHDKPSSLRGSGPEQDEVRLEAFAALRASGVPLVVVDCREQWEYDLARLEGALLIPLRELAARAGEVPPGADVVVYCHHGVRSRTGAAILRREGVSRAVSLQGGLDAWSLSIDSTVPRYQARDASNWRSTWPRRRRLP